MLSNIILEWTGEFSYYSGQNVRPGALGSGPGDNITCADLGHIFLWVSTQQPRKRKCNWGEVWVSPRRPLTRLCQPDISPAIKTPQPGVLVTAPAIRGLILSSVWWKQIGLNRDLPGQVKCYSLYVEYLYSNLNKKNAGRIPSCTDPCHLTS